MKILVTGASGFVGRRLIQVLISQGHEVIGVGRRKFSAINYRYEAIDDLASYGGWASLLNGCEVVVHLAARVHVMKDYSINPLQEFLAVNLDGTIRIADEACRAGVKRIVYLSSIKVNGEINNGSPFLETDMPNPIDPYAISKWRAEQALQDISQHSSLEVVIIRPPLIYGPGVKGNFASMVSWINKGFPTPFGSVQNKRSLVALDNLISLIMVCCANPAAANQIFLVSDNQDLSTSELLRQIARLLKVRILFIPLPTVILRILFFVMGKNALAQRLLGSLQIDISKARALLGWSPPITLEEGLSRAVNFHAEHYL